MAKCVFEPGLITVSVKITYWLYYCEAYFKTTTTLKCLSSFELYFPGLLSPTPCGWQPVTNSLISLVLNKKALADDPHSRGDEYSFNTVKLHNPPELWASASTGSFCLRLTKSSVHLTALATHFIPCLMLDARKSRCKGQQNTRHVEKGTLVHAAFLTSHNEVHPLLNNCSRSMSTALICVWISTLWFTFPDCRDAWGIWSLQILIWADPIHRFQTNLQIKLTCLSAFTFPKCSKLKKHKSTF